MAINETKNKILNVSVKLFKENDYNKISIRKICKLANISIGSFYHQIGSKENLVRIIYQDINENTLELMKNIKTKSYKEKILLMAKIHIDSVEYYGYKYYSYFLKLRLRNLIPFDDYIYMEETIKAAIDSKELSDNYSSEFISREFISVGRGIVCEWVNTQGKLDLSLTLNTMVNILIDKFENKNF